MELKENITSIVQNTNLLSKSNKIASFKQFAFILRESYIESKIVDIKS